MSISNSNTLTLQNNYKNNLVWHDFMEGLLVSEIEAPVSTVESLMEYLRNVDKPITREDVIKILKSLKALGIGDFKHGRHKKASRFTWFFASADVAKLARGSCYSARNRIGS